MKNKLFPLIYSLLLICFTQYVILDAFVIERVYEIVENDTSNTTVDYSNDDDETESTLPTVTESSYKDGKVSITISEHRVLNTTVYVADVILKKPELLKTAFAKDSYGKNVKEKTSVIARGKNAILAVNGDYYSAREGCVLRNGVLYRDFSGDSDDQSLIIKEDGSFAFENGNTGNGNELLENGAKQILSFGPALLIDGVINVDTNDEVDKAMRNNPRTAIAWYGEYHYAFIVADGRTNESTGLSLYELASFAKELGANDVYNLDGGGSSTMYFNGRVVNKPTTNGNRMSEREVSDIVYIGY